MRPVLVYKADPLRGQRWAEVFRDEMPQVDFRCWPDVGDTTAVRYLVAWEPPADLGTRFPQLSLLFSSGAGVDQFDFGVLPAALPVVRMVEPGIEQGMVEYVLHAVLDLHRDRPAYRRAQQQACWQPLPVRTAAERRVGVLGLGQLGRAVLGALRGLGFDCAGWSRSQHQVDGVPCLAGAAQLPAFLARCDILVCLLPLTPATRGVLNATLLRQLPRGAALVQVGRGPQLVQHDLLQLLHEGHVSEAVLDVTDPEPLPADSPLWQHPRVQLTPHIASMTQPVTAARAVIDNLRRFERGEPLVGLVDRERGY